MSRYVCELVDAGTGRTEGYIVYDNTSGQAISEAFLDEDEAQAFLTWYENTDVSQYRTIDDLMDGFTQAQGVS